MPEKLRSMMWGMDAFPDGSIWFTDEIHRCNMEIFN